MPLLTWFFVAAWKKRQRLIQEFIPRRLVKDLTVGVSRGRQKSRMVLATLAVLLVIVALARPRWGFEWDEATQRGLDIVVAIDASRSMLAMDVKPNRLERAKLAAMDLMKVAKSDRIGLVTFAGTAFLQCPLTLDDNAFRQSVNAISPNVMPQGGTAIAETIQVAMEAFKNEEENYKILVIITDGEDHEEAVLEAGEEAAKDDMRIFTLGIGSAEGDLIPLGGRGTTMEYLKDQSGQVVRSRLNEALLQQLAGVGKGFCLNLSAGWSDRYSVCSRPCALAAWGDFLTVDSAVFRTILLAALGGDCFAFDRNVHARPTQIEKAEDESVGCDGVVSDGVVRIARIASGRVDR